MMRSDVGFVPEGRLDKAEDVGEGFGGEILDAWHGGAIVARGGVT